jgi:hypothetical protein
MKKTNNTIISILLVAVMLFAFLPNSIVSANTEPIRALSESEVLKQKRIHDLGLSVSETSFDLGENYTAFSARLDDYVALGIKAIRFDTYWDSPSPGVWRISDETKNMIRISAEKGLLVKLIFTTIKSPPEWMEADENTRYKDYNGRLSKYIVSHWYDGIKEYAEQTLRAQLEELKKYGLLNAIGAIHVDSGIWNEPIYPHEASQRHDWLEANGEFDDAVLWCYGDNAIIDFRIKMQGKYGTIKIANNAWKTSYAAFDVITPPKPGEVKGLLWEDMLSWYLGAKDNFCDWQIGMFKRVVGEYYDDMILILNATGLQITNYDWISNIKSGTASYEIKLGADNHFLIDLADKYNCLLQYTGLMDLRNLKAILGYMNDNNKFHIPLYGENAISIYDDPEILINAVGEYGLAGLDFTYTQLLYEADGVTKGKYYFNFVSNMDLLKQYILNPIPWIPPDNTGKPEGDVLRYDVKFNKMKDKDYAYTFMRIAEFDYTVVEGDVLEYDVKISKDIAGLGTVDGMIGEDTIRDNSKNIDQNGIQTHPGNYFFTNLISNDFNSWFRRKVNISNSETIGKQLTEIQLAMHPEQKADEFSNLSVVIWYDNIRITNNGKVKLVIFESAKDIDISKAELVNSRNASAKVSIVKVGNSK